MTKKRPKAEPAALTELRPQLANRGPRVPVGSSTFAPVLESNLNAVRNAFGIDNAKQLPVEETVHFFVPQGDFKRLFVPKNHILIGSRGSGKTTWVRMLAHDHVWLAAREAGHRTEYAREALQNNLIGIYVPASAAFAGDLKNKPWQSEAEAEEYFVWRLNLHACAALSHIIDTCISQYEIRTEFHPQIQVDICRELSAVWTDGRESCTTYDGLRLILTGLELRHQSELRRRRISPSTQMAAYSDHFDSALFLPLRHSINLIRSKLSIPATAVWMICLDEVEYLTELHHRILNTQMRSASGDLVFKIATMPFAHRTLATNLGDPVREGNDFEYIYVDREPIDSRGAQAQGEFLTFARELFKLRIKFRSPKLSGITLKSLLGPSPLLDDKKIDGAEDIESFMALLRRHANPRTITRAERLQFSPKFKDEVVRKMHGALVLRDAISRQHGNTKPRIYAGEAIIVRCCDGNARRLMRVINSLVQRVAVDEQDQPILPIDSAVQNEILEGLARDTIHRTQSEPPEGEITSRYLEAIGKYMQWTFASSQRRIGTDQVTSVRITEDDGSRAQLFIRQAVQLSLMIPSRGLAITAPNQICTGVFHLSFIFAPLFRLLPRRNDSVRLARVLAHASHISRPDTQRDLLEGA